MNTVADLARAVLLHLGGRPVKLRWRRPSTAEYSGQVYATKSGLVCDIDPTCGDHLLYIVCHEAAHVKLHSHRFPVTRDADLYPGAIRRGWESLKRERRTDPVIRAAEQQADDLAHHWMAWADQNCRRYGSPGDQIETRKLYALLDYGK